MANGSRRPTDIIQTAWVMYVDNGRRAAAAEREPDEIIY